MLDHRISVRSRYDHGSMFALELPIATPVPATKPVPRRVGAWQADLSGMAVLCIDNEPEILNGMRTLLGGWGCDVQTAHDGATAQELMRERSSKPDVLLADYHLDTENGLDLIVKLRWKFGRDIPAILITADRSRSLSETALSKGIVVINKPVKPAALRALLARHRTNVEAAE